jgi:hypothetical protein
MVLLELQDHCKIALPPLPSVKLMSLSRHRLSGLACNSGSKAHAATGVFAHLDIVRSGSLDASQIHSSTDLWADPLLVCYSAVVPSLDPALSRPLNFGDLRSTIGSGDMSWPSAISASLLQHSSSV